MSQTSKAVIALRELILLGNYPPGETLREATLAEEIGTSRTPIRTALAQLADEGLIAKAGGSGYVVRSFTVEEVAHAIEMRGMLEGMAARLIIERNLDPHHFHPLHDCINQVEGVLNAADAPSADGITIYFEMNDLFHRTLIELADSFVMQRAMERVLNMPFASPNAFVHESAEMQQSWRTLILGHEQHRAILAAIENGQMVRIESLLREHAYLSLRTLKRYVDHQYTLAQVPGASLITIG